MCFRKRKYINRIRQYRKKRHLKLKDIKRSINHQSCALISGWEKGRYLPSLINALKLAVALNCPVEILFLEQYKAIRREVAANQKKYTIKIKYDYDNKK